MSQQQTIAHYRITSKLGEGGMGAVYRATDTKLNRDVAIKILPDSFANDPDRLARFTREAQVLASLNHPNIAAIYGVEERALIMELVEGPTLAERIAQGPIPLDEAVPIARQMAEALEYAHDKGIVHRDLKPANVKVTEPAGGQPGRVKVLDFGLAKALSPELSAANPANSPTLSMRATVAGMIMGTAGYMSPEQAKGKPVDRRADIWAFGVLLVEMLTGRAMYAAETISETLASVLLKEPDLSGLPARTPAAIRTLIRRCLDKDPQRRLRDIGEARIALENPGAVPEAVAARSAPARRSPLPWIAAGVCLAAFAVLAFFHFRESPPETAQIVFPIAPPEGGAFNFLALSPDGRQIAYSAGDSSGKVQIWVRSLASLAARPLPGTDGASGLFWSPDSRFIAFFAGTRLLKVAASGGPTQTICAINGTDRGGSWGRDGTILISYSNQGLLSVPASGGEPKPATALDRANGVRDLSHRWPWFLPDGRHFLYDARSARPDQSGIYLASLDSRDPSHLVLDDSNAAYSAGYLLFARNGNLMAQAFDAASLRLSGDAVPVAEQVGQGQIADAAYSRFSASESGVLVYDSTGASASRLTWFDRQGKRLGMLVEPGLGGQPRISPDGKRIVASQAGSEIYLVDVGRDVSTRFTFNKGVNMFPAWSPDGHRVYYASAAAGSFDLYWKSADMSGPEELLLRSEISKYPTDVSPDGRFLMFSQLSPKTGIDLFLLPLTDAGGDRKPVAFLQTPAAEQSGVFSPDGKWVAYTSDESGRSEIYLRPFSPPGTDRSQAGQRQVSKGGGQFARWRGDSRELYYFSGENKIAAVTIETSPTVQIGVPRPLFGAFLSIAQRFAVTADGQRFLMAAPVGEAHGAPATVVVNWTKALKP